MQITSINVAGNYTKIQKKAIRFYHLELLA